MSANCVPEQTEYEFDPEFFAVTETGNGARRVSLKMSRINSMVDEVVNELEVQVNVTGIIECTADGTLRVANTTTAGRLTDSTHVDSFISY